MENLKWIGWLIAFVLLLIVVFQRSCTQQPTVIVEPPEIVYVYDTIPDIITKTVTELRVDTVIVPVRIPIAPDTLAIIADYFSKVKYKDTLIDDSSALLVLNETLYKNRLFEREIIFLNKRPKETYIKEPYPTPVVIRKPQLFIGGELSTGPGIQDFGVGFGYIDPKRGIFTYHYGLVRKEHKIGYHIELRNFKLFN